jgi:hypothetical protein
MGYTHYWEFRKAKRGTTKQVNQTYFDAVKACQTIVCTYSQANGGLSGFAAHTKPGTYGGLKVNGSRENGHEDFVLRETFKLALDNNGSEFCKTNAKPYDVVVVACLCILKHRLGDSIVVNSDGDSLDWVKGLELARRVLKDKTIQIPATIRRRIGVIA